MSLETDPADETAKASRRETEVTPPVEGPSTLPLGGPTTDGAADAASGQAVPEATRALLSTVTHAPLGDEEGKRAEATTAAFRLPGFEILEVLGRGGMGIVYKARQLSLNRLVALKTLPPAFAADPMRLQRFRNEAAIAARLSDSRILEVHDVLEADGVPVLVMPYIDGPDLQRIIKYRLRVRDAHSQGSQASRTRAGEQSYLDALLPFLDQLVDAVASLHQENVLHRDIKPSNVLCDLKGNVRLSDLGLARLGEGTDLTRPGSELGTPGYMAPEQYNGQSKPDSRADVFGLGATIYHALTLTLPYGRERITAREALPKPPSARQRLLTPDHDAVILKALEPDREDRYKSAQEFREDWWRIRQGFIPRVRRIGPIRRLGRFMRRHPVGSAYTFVLAGFLTLSLAAWYFAPVHPDAPRWVRIHSDLPFRRFALVPLDQATGRPMGAAAVIHDIVPATQVDVKAGPGDYLIEIEWPDRPFHEVYRHVPRPEEQGHPGAYAHRSWITVGRVLQLPSIQAPPIKVLDDMVLFAGLAGFPVPPPSGTLTPSKTVDVAPFWLDRTEVTVGAFKAINRRNPPRSMPPGLFRGRPEEDRWAIRCLEADQAISYAERFGKRLPDVNEYLCAARNGAEGTTYPWGFEPPEDCRTPWVFGPVGGYARDRLRSHSDLEGLYSNAAEWTSTWNAADVGLPPGAFPPEVGRQYVVCGAPPDVLDGEIADPDCARGTAERTAADRFRPYNGVGLRGARSDRPRFLPPSRPARQAAGSP
jgi:serine/threonine-protein kinase